MNLAYQFTKRSIDVLLSGLGIVVLSPILILTTMILWMTGEHKVMYRQRRIGKDYNPFFIYKFVTMRSDSEKFGTITAKNDPRVLPVGKVLRKSKINELPQLFNILFGDMSIIGPRPLAGAEVDMYPDDVRALVYDNNKPGLTGIGSLFFRDEDELIAGTKKPPEEAYREDVMPIKGRIEIWYRENKSLRIDLLIFFLTVLFVFNLLPVSLVSIFRKFDTFPSKPLSQYRSLVAARDSHRRNDH